MLTMHNDDGIVHPMSTNAANTANTASTSARTANGTSCCGGTSAAGAAESCCSSAADAFKAGLEANQKLFNSMTSAFTTAVNEMTAKAWNPAMNNPFAASFGTLPASFERMTKAMNTLVDANARFASECNALVIDAMRANARTLERAGTVMLGQLTGKAGKPVADATREIMDECGAFATQTSERLNRMNGEHLRQVTQVMEQVTARA